MRCLGSLVDVVRLDHFLGYVKFWEIPYNEEYSAVNGYYVQGPG